ncbi:MAG: class B sortase [Lachnospiraceae bacterium]|nr:class B sortase [Lachnospiraceae bacterium]
MSEKDLKKTESSSTGTEKNGAEEKPKKKKKKTSPVTILLMLVCVAIFCYAGYQLASIYLEYGEAESEYEELAVSYQIPEAEDETEESVEADPVKMDPLEWPSYAVDLDTLQNLNSDIIGWICMPGTNVNYPIVRAEDNNYYLRRTIRGTYNKSGSIFMDCANKPEFTDLNTIIYGHNMKNGSMFGSFKKFYQEEGFPEEHPYFYIYTPDKKWNKYMIFSCYHTQSDSSSYDYVTEDMYVDYVEKALKNSLFDFGVEVDTENKKTVVTLSTCSGKSGGTQRFLIHGVWVDEKITDDSLLK